MTKEEAISAGNKYYCGQCHAVYKNVPTFDHEMGGCAQKVAECSRCGCDLIARFSDDELAQSGVDY